MSMIVTRVHARGGAVAYGEPMKIFLIVLLVAAVLLGIVGFLVKALLWLAFVGIVLFLLTALYWWFKFRSSGSKDVETAR